MKSRLIRAWKLLPKVLRKTIVLLIGSTLVLTGLLLIVLPGKFTLPLLVLGLIILALEFAWAEVLLNRVRDHGAKLNPRKFFKKQSGS